MFVSSETFELTRKNGMLTPRASSRSPATD
jgi:hypothetical protein